MYSTTSAGLDAGTLREQLMACDSTADLLQTMVAAQD